MEWTCRRIQLCQILLVPFTDQFLTVTRAFKLVLQPQEKQLDMKATDTEVQNWLLKTLQGTFSFPIGAFFICKGDKIRV
jgi:hypothetical protein